MGEARPPLQALLLDHAGRSRGAHATGRRARPAPGAHRGEHPPHPLRARLAAAVRGMSTARATVRVPGRAAEAEALWYDLGRWPAFVEGFAAVVRNEGGWPRAGATLVWDSTPGGRGRVVERVTAYEPRAGQTLQVEDEQLRGEQRIAFSAAGQDLDVGLSLAYTLKRGGPFMWAADVTFIRRAVRDSLRRTLVRFAHELAAERRPASG